MKHESSGSVLDLLARAESHTQLADSKSFVSERALASPTLVTQIPVNSEKLQFCASSAIKLLPAVIDHAIPGEMLLNRAGYLAENTREEEWSKAAAPNHQNSLSTSEQINSKRLDLPLSAESLPGSSAHAGASSLQLLDAAWKSIKVMMHNFEQFESYYIVYMRRRWMKLLQICLLLYPRRRLLSCHRA
jgi:hypothetical protein